jgi:hypothetical protein
MEIVFGVIALIVSVVSAIISWKSVKAAESSASYASNSNLMSALREFVLPEYLERDFKATQAPKIEGKIITSLRQAKQIAKRVNSQNPEEWDKVSRRSNLGAWQNQVAFETAWALNSLGTFAFAGCLPLPNLLALAADTIIDDWLLCRSWVRSYREDEGDTEPSGTTVMQTTRFLHRWQAEWLTLVAVLWLERHRPYPGSDHVAEWYGGKENLTAKLQALSHAGGIPMPQTVRDEVRFLTDVEISV